MTPPLDRAAVAAVDSTGQAAEVLDLATHLRDALWRVDSAALAPAPQPGPLVIAGMGGSAIGGLLATAAIGQRATQPVLAARGYDVPGWVGPGATVLLSSYSGDTEETLAAYDAAGEAGARRIAATTGGELAERARRDGLPVVPMPGGFQPRAAVGYTTVIALEAAALAGAAPSLRDEVERAATLLERLAGQWGPDGDEASDAKALARALHGHVPVVLGAELASAAAYRWKSQINENAKLPAFASELPEAHHNEVCGWAGDAAPFAAVVLQDDRAHPRNVVRAQLTASVLQRTGMTVAQARAYGETRTERVLSLVLLGDLVSLYLAVLRGVDPVDVAMIGRLKAELAAA